MADLKEFTVSVPSAKGDLRFSTLDGFDELNRPFRYEIAFVADTADIKAKDVLGTPAIVTVEGDKVRHFHGLIVEFSIGEAHDQNKSVEYRVVVMPWLWFLSLRSNNKIFQKKSAVEIIEAIFGDYGDAKFEKRLKKKYPAREYCVQYGESDLAFVQRLMEHEGIGYFFEHTEDQHLMVLFDASSDLAPPEGIDSIGFGAERDAARTNGDYISAWLPEAVVRTGKYAQTDYDFEKPSSDLMSKSENAHGHAEDKREVYFYPGNYIDHGRGDALSAVRLEELQHPFVRISAAGRTRPLWSGHTFKFEGYPRESEDGEYLVLRSDYRLRHAETGGGQEGPTGFSARLLLAPKATAFRPERRTLKPVMRGPQTAMVVGPSGQEIFTDKYARVKVQFHWDRLGKKDENTTCFIRVSQTWAGSGWGFIQIPRIGQEVIVDFLEGDPDQPIITGRVYNAEQMPPYGLPAQCDAIGVEVEFLARGRRLERIAV